MCGRVRTTGDNGGCTPWRGPAQGRSACYRPPSSSSPPLKHGVPSSLPHERPRLPRRLRVSVHRGVQLVSPDDALCSRRRLHSTGPGGPAVGSSALLKTKRPSSQQDLLRFLLRFLRAQRPSRPAIPSCCTDRDILLRLCYDWDRERGN